jgi:hypothetical protein
MTPEETSMVREEDDRSSEGELAKAYLTLWRGCVSVAVWSSVGVWGAGVALVTGAAAEGDGVTGAGSIWRWGWLGIRGAVCVT